MKVAVLSDRAVEYRRLLDIPGFEEPSQLLAEMPDVEVLLADPDLAAGVVDGLSELRWLQSSWAGVEALVRSGMRSDYLLTRVVDVFGPQMREFVLGYLLWFERRIAARRDAQRRHIWAGPDHETLSGKTLGIAGTGSIGAAIAQAAQAMGMTTVGCSQSARPVEGFDRVLGASRKLKLAEQVDHLVAVLPATPETEHFIDRRMIERLSPRSVVINVGRGITVSTEAVVAALEKGGLAGAVLDVLEVEPLAADSELWDVPNLVLTCHTAAVSYPVDVAGVFAANLERYLEGLPLKGAVDFERGY